MSESNIEWTDATWNPVVGCSRVSPGCERCYAEVMAARIEKMGTAPRYRGLTVVGKHGPRWAGMARPAPEVLADPLHWRKPRRVFVNSMSDLFHEDLPFEYIAAVFGVMAACPQHTFQVLTKRPERMLEFFRWLDLARPPWLTGPTSCDWRVHYLADVAHEATQFDGECGPLPEAWPLPNVHLGVSVEDQRRADERIPLLLQCPAAVRWVSAEPLLGPVDFWGFSRTPGASPDDITEEDDAFGPPLGGVAGIDWVVVGGESGRDPRPFDIAWARSIVGQCKAAGVPVFVKQLGAVAVVKESEWRTEGVSRLLSASASKRAPEGFVALHLGDKKGGDPRFWPEDLRVREWPEAGQ